MRLTERIAHAWNAFTSPEIPLTDSYLDSMSRPTRKYAPRTNASAFTGSIFNRIALDVALTTFEHVRENPDNEDLEPIPSGLNYCLNTEANIDQTGVAFIHDIVYSMFDDGAVVVVPVDTTISPIKSGGFDIQTMRVGSPVDWRSENVKVRLYNEKTGKMEDIWLPKHTVAIIENPLYAVINEPNSTLQRLLRKMSLMDAFDEVVGAGKLDIIIQSPHPIRNKTQRENAEKRIQSVDEQLRVGKHGIAYIDGTERITQLNRAANNQMLESVKVLTEQFYNQLGLTPKIFDGTASETEMRNYYARTIDPIVTFIVKEMERKFLTKTARTQGHKINTYRDIFKLVPVEQIVSLGDAFRRNEVATSNEIRKLIGLKVSNDPLADQLSNPNLYDHGPGEEDMIGGLGVAEEEGPESTLDQLIENTLSDPELEEMEEELPLEEQSKLDGLLEGTLFKTDKPQPPAFKPTYKPPQPTRYDDMITEILKAPRKSKKNKRK